MAMQRKRSDSPSSWGASSRHVPPMPWSSSNGGPSPSSITFSRVPLTSSINIVRLFLSADPSLDGESPLGGGEHFGRHGLHVDRGGVHQGLEPDAPPQTEEHDGLCLGVDLRSDLAHLHSFLQRLDDEGAGGVLVVIERRLQL